MRKLTASLTRRPPNETGQLKMTSPKRQEFNGLHIECTEDELLFLHTYMGNGFKAEYAAKVAGFTKNDAKLSPGWIRPGHKAFRPNVHAQYREFMAAKVKEAHISSNRVLQELALIGFSNIATFLETDENGFTKVKLDPDMVDHISMSSPMGAIKRINFGDERHVGIGENEITVQNTIIDMYDKVQALAVLAHCVGLLHAPRIHVNDIAFAGERGLTTEMSKKLGMAIIGMTTGSLMQSEDGLVSYDADTFDPDYGKDAGDAVEAVLSEEEIAAAQEAFQNQDA